MLHKTPLSNIERVVALYAVDANADADWELTTFACAFIECQTGHEGKEGLEKLCPKKGFVRSLAGQSLLLVLVRGACVESGLGKGEKSSRPVASTLKEYVLLIVES